MLSLLKGSVGETAAPLIFLVLFLVKSYFDGMLEEDPAETADTSVQKGGDSHV